MSIAITTQRRGSVTHVLVNGMVVDTFYLTNGEWVSPIGDGSFRNLYAVQTYILDNVLA